MCVCCLFLKSIRINNALYHILSATYIAGMCWWLVHTQALESWRQGNYIGSILWREMWLQVTAAHQPALARTPNGHWPMWRVFSPCIPQQRGHCARFTLVYICICSMVSIMYGETVAMGRPESVVHKLCYDRVIRTHTHTQTRRWGAEPFLAAYLIDLLQDTLNSLDTQWDATYSKPVSVCCIIANIHIHIHMCTTWAGNSMNSKICIHWPTLLLLYVVLDWSRRLGPHMQHGVHLNMLTNPFGC